MKWQKKGMLNKNTFGAKMCDIWPRPRTTQSTRWVTYNIENAVWYLPFKNASKKLYNLIIQLRTIN